MHHYHVAEGVVRFLLCLKVVFSLKVVREDAGGGEVVGKTDFIVPAVFAVGESMRVGKDVVIVIVCSIVAHNVINLGVSLSVRRPASFLFRILP